jgi:aldehyde dehydrogenase (NAD+)
VYDSLVPRLKQAYAYASVAIGNPLDTNTLVGPLIDGQAFAVMQKALDAAKAAGGIVTGGTRVEDGTAPDAYYVRPAIVEMPEQTGPMEQVSATRPCWRQCATRVAIRARR